ncbi:MAG TPA: phosphonate ABC transporter ATP-binding protein [Symbiobacteriaceae bacterium]|nr:phosphonate ABC transporter ATP-binding protein [Symbiobacteriaceae bacterium]
MLQFKNIAKTFPDGTKALKNVNLTVNEGEFIVIVGLSGAGKSTLIRCINRLVEPTAGQLLAFGQDVTKMSDAELRRWRTQVGMIFQSFNLVKRSSVLQNVLAGRLGHTGTMRSLLGMWSHDDIELAKRCLERVGIPEKLYNRADALSGGQQQRVSIARALCQKPKIMLADEPVASLDPPTSHSVLRDLKRINREDKITTFVNLHFIDMAQEYADRIIGMRAGDIVFDGPAKDVTEQTFEEIYGRKIRPEDTRAGAVREGA